MAYPWSRREGAKANSTLRALVFVAITALVFLGSYFVTLEFGAADTRGWLDDVGLTVVVIVIAIAAATAAAAVLIAVRAKRRRNTFL
jgi:hypothetical protein